MIVALYLSAAAALATLFAFTLGAIGVPSFDLGSTIGAAVNITGAALIALVATFRRND